MGRLREFQDYKNTIMEKLTSSEEIVKLLTDEGMDLNSTEKIDGTTLMYKKIFPYRFMPDAESNEVSSYITTSYRDIRKFKTKFKAGKIIFYVICHNDLIRTNVGRLRYDLILDEIDSIFNESTDFGIGKLEFIGIDEFESGVKEYVVNTISYRFVEFN